MTNDEPIEPALTQDDILRQTKAVVQGLDTLKADHLQTLASLRAGIKSDIGDSGMSELNDDRASVLGKSLEQLELGISEAQVYSSQSVNFFSYGVFRRWYCPPDSPADSPNFV